MQSKNTERLNQQEGNALKIDTTASEIFKFLAVYDTNYIPTRTENFEIERKDDRKILSGLCKLSSIHSKYCYYSTPTPNNTEWN